LHQNAYRRKSASGFGSRGRRQYGTSPPHNVGGPLRVRSALRLHDTPSFDEPSLSVGTRVIGLQVWRSCLSTWMRS